jgi:adenosylcobinamide kinase/adenosylcobinamide-phosphate guanylyltransferase
VKALNAVGLDIGACDIKVQSEIILVSNETGLGVVPLGEISRRFVDEAGRLHQALGQIADKVVFCVAGFPMILKGEK